LSLPEGAHDARRVGGGDINEAWRVRLTDGSEAFVKTRADAAEGEYRREAEALRWLGEAGSLRVPRVLEVAEHHLVLEWVQAGHLSRAGEEELGRGLATMHRAGAPHFGDFRRRLPGGHETVADPDGEAGRAAGFGSLRLPDTPSEDWPSFYAQRRLLPLAGHARACGALSAAGVAAVERICGRLDELAGPPEPPARIHGDLWSGNVHADEDGRPWLIDPSAYGGHREVDLAMLRLFGSPAERIFAAYEELTPLSEGWRERVELWQLLPLLVHAVLFGGSYGPAAERVAARCAGCEAAREARRTGRGGGGGTLGRAAQAEAVVVDTRAPHRPRRLGVDTRAPAVMRWVGVPDVRSRTLSEHRRLYLLARAAVARDYARPLTLGSVARGLSVSPRQLQRLYAQFGGQSFREDLLGRRMRAAAALLAQQRTPVGEVGRLVGYRHPAHFARAFDAYHGVSPRRYRSRQALR
jgi:fructosamine-3-kinase/AraC-like DNA-binding protein